MKTFKSSSFAVEFKGTRAIAISAAREYLSRLITDGTIRSPEHRYTWRADDGSGFTLALTSLTLSIYVSHKWNAARN